MAHPYHKEAKEGHAKKLSGYGGKGKTYDGKGTWDGLKGLNTDEQRGLKPIDKEPELSQETAPRIMRKKGGKVMGKKAVARLDKPMRKGRDAGGSGITQSDKDAMKDTIDKNESDIRPEEYQKGNLDKSSGEYALKKGGRVKKAVGGKMKHEDEAEDRKLIKKMVKPEDLTGKSYGGRMKRERGGPVKGKTTVNIIVGAGNKPQDQMGAGNIAPVPGIPVGTRPQMPPPQQPPMAPPMMGAPMGAPPAMAPPMAPPPAPPMGGAPMGGNPLMRKAGGRANADVPVKTPGRTPEGYPKMDYGAASGKGRRQKIVAQSEGDRKGFK